MPGRNRTIAVAWGVVGLAVMVMSGCGKPAIILAANHGTAAEVARLVHDDPGCVKRTDEYGDQALNMAVERGDLGICKLLLDAGADPNHESPRTDTPLIFAAYYQTPELVELLIHYGADVNRATTDGSGRTPLYAAAMRGQLKMVQVLLKHGADPRHKAPSGQIPLFGAMNSQLDQKERVDVIKALLDAGSDINAHDTSHHTPLWYASERGMTSDILKYLESQGAVKE